MVDYHTFDQHQHFEKWAAERLPDRTLLGNTYECCICNEDEHVFEGDKLLGHDDNFWLCKRHARERGVLW